MGEAIDRSRGGPGTSTDYQTTERLKQGLVGERLAAEGLAQQGHKILSYKPDIKGTNQGGIDIVTIKEGQVYFIDNKAYTTGRNVAAVSALDKNFAQNVAEVRAQFAQYAVDPNRSEAERNLYQQAVDAIDGGNYQKAVTTAGIAPDGKHSPGITPGLDGNSFVHIPIGPPNKAGGGAPPTHPLPNLVVTPGTEMILTSQPGTQLAPLDQPGTQLTPVNQPGTQIAPLFDARLSTQPGPGSTAGPGPNAMIAPVFDQKGTAPATAPGPGAGSPPSPPASGGPAAGGGVGLGTKPR